MRRATAVVGRRGQASSIRELIEANVVEGYVLVCLAAACLLRRWMSVTASD